MDSIPPEVRRLFEASEARRQELAALPWEQKIRIVVGLQRMAAPILRARGLDVMPWELDETPEEAART